MSSAANYAENISLTSADTTSFDSSLAATLLVASVGMLLSLFATAISPAWFVG
jgi:hypothetical protein